LIHDFVYLSSMLCSLISQNSTTLLNIGPHRDFISFKSHNIGLVLQGDRS
jgi:hypothetical protein